MKKVIFFDTNVCAEVPGVYPISELAVRDKKLAEGELVTAYMLGEYEYWDAKVLHLDGQWGIELLSDAREMTRARYEGQHEGFTEGMLCQKQRALRVLENLDLPDTLLAEARRKMEEI